MLDDKKYNFIEKEAKWQKFWQEEKIYKFEENSTKKIFSIDTPPPTVSGKIHIGHIMGFVQADITARYKRMRGFNLFYPLGFDNNGLPTELLVEKERKIRAYSLPREEFTKICLEVVDKYNKAYTDTFLRAGNSSDLSLSYNTIDPRSQKTSQMSFIDLYKKGLVYRDEKPSPWCTKCRTSVAGFELESKDIDSKFNYLNFKLNDGSDVIKIATTRPEFLPACVAIFVNPDDEKNKKYIGKKVIVPLFNQEVTVLTDEKVGIDKGTGAVMCCTFGDETDVYWWKTYNLPFIQAIDDGGKMTEVCGKYAGLKTTEARAQILEDLKNEGFVYRQDEITHAVQVHERCKEPIEMMTKKQWFIKTASEEEKQQWLSLGDKIAWHPDTMKARYNSWVENMNQDWNISRQRYFGVPFPLWYCKDCGNVILANEEDLPVNPLSSSPKSLCPKCGSKEFIPEIDVMDTWATSSVTPQINCKYSEDKEFYEKMMPMDLRFSGREIITTWNLRTIIKSHYHSNKLPWKNLMINGWVMADKGIKISKSLSNSKMELEDLFKTYGADVIRYWCSNGAYGRDAIFSDDELKNGSKLLNKIYNSSKFVLSFLKDYDMKKPTTILPMDLYYIQKFNLMQEKAIEFLEDYEMGYAKAEIEKYFWDYCDNYIEIVKNRLYKPEIYGQEAKQSGLYALYNIHSSILKLLAIYMPFITEEVYQAYFKQFEGKISIHNTEIAKIDNDCDEKVENGGNEFIEIISQIRAFKSEKQVSVKTLLDKVTIKSKNISFLETCLYDLLAVCNIQKIELEKADELCILYGNFIEEKKSEE